MKNTEQTDLNDRYITKARFIQVNQLPQIDAHLTAKLYFDTEKDQSSLVRNNQDNDFNSNNLTIINSITLSKQAENDNEVITKALVDQFHQQNERSLRDVGLDFYDESNKLVKSNQDNILNDKKLTNLDSITPNRNPSLDNELTNKLYVDNELDENTVIRFNQTLQTLHLKVSVGNDTYNLTKNNKISITDITEIKFPNTGINLLQKGNNFCNNKINQSRINDFIKSTRSNSPTGVSGATSLSPVGNAFMYIKASDNNSGDNVFISWERTDFTQITKKTLYYNI